jgi:cytochrome c
MNRLMITFGLSCAALTGGAMADDVAQLAKAKGCFGCHDAKLAAVGPSFSDIARRFSGLRNAKMMLARVIETGSVPGTYHWAEDTKMPAGAARAPVSKDEAEKLAAYVLSFKQ